MGLIALSSGEKEWVVWVSLPFIMGRGEVGVAVSCIMGGVEVVVPCLVGGVWVVVLYLVGEEG